MKIIGLTLLSLLSGGVHSHDELAASSSRLRGSAPVVSDIYFSQMPIHHSTVVLQYTQNIHTHDMFVLQY